MGEGERIIVALIGFAALIWAFWPGVTFRAGAFGTGSRRPIPKWLGRVLFVSIGLWFTYTGIVGNQKIGRVTAAIIGFAIGVELIYSAIAGSRPRKTSPAGLRFETEETSMRRKGLPILVGLFFLWIALKVLTGR